MKRRTFLEMAGAAAAANMLDQGGNAQAAIPPGASEVKLMAAPCGIYCGICSEYTNGRCHGCDCPCGKCAGGKYAAGCEWVKCVRDRKIESCAECPELPCTKLIERDHDPLNVFPLVENLRRCKRIGREAWVAEQKQYWSDKKKRDRFAALLRENGEREQKYYK
jgi:hypothetical protein